MSRKVRGKVVISSVLHYAVALEDLAVLRSRRVVLGLVK